MSEAHGIPTLGERNPSSQGSVLRAVNDRYPEWVHLPSHEGCSRRAVPALCDTATHAGRDRGRPPARPGRDQAARSRSDDDFEIVGETQSGTQVLPLVGKEKPDLVLLDVRMPHMDGLACLDEIKRRHPDVKVVMLSASTSPTWSRQRSSRGASAYIVKTVSPDDLPATLRQALEGNVHTAIGMDEERLAARSRSASPSASSPSSALARGLSNDEIAKEFWVAPQTVKFHLTNIYRKLGVKNRTEATRLAYQHGLVESPIYSDE